MKITWIGHSCFAIESNGYKVVTDPYGDGSVPGLRPVRESAQEVLVSHEHGDHNARQAVEIAAGGESPFTITVIDTYHDPVKGALRGRNKIHILETEGVKIAHFGDLGCKLKPTQLEMLKGLDVAMIPVGGFFTINAKEAAELVQAIKPAHVIPMHFRDDEKGFGFGVIGPVKDFTDRFEQVVSADGSTLETEDAPQAQVIVLTPANR